MDVYRTPSLPSLSALTGNVRPQTTAALIEHNIEKVVQKRAFRSNSAAPAYGQETSKEPNAGQVNALTRAAFKHLVALEKAPGTPYKRPSTSHDLRAQFQHEATSRLQHVTDANNNPKPQAQKFADLPYRPATSCSAIEGGSLASQAHSTLNKLAKLKGLPVAQSWPGPGLKAAIEAEQAQQKNKQGTMVVNAPAVDAPAVTAEQKPAAPAPQVRPEVWVNKSYEEPKAPQPHKSHNVVDMADSMTDISYRSNRTKQSGAQVATRKSISALGDTGGKPRLWGGKTLAALSNFVPSRGMVYSVFADLDEFDKGRLTWSAFEDAAYVIGMKPDQARKFFNSLDSEGHGYITTRDWGRVDKLPQIQAFTRLYIQQTRGSTGKPQSATEVRSVEMALQMAVLKLQLKNNGRSISHERLLDAFRFIDVDENGTLDKSELADAFAALGIWASPEVTERIMATFDKDANGTVDYHEFLTTLHPTLGKGIH